jgi:hypothetical protein
VASLDTFTADALAGTIRELQRQVAELAHLRRRPSPGATLQAANTAQTFAGTSSVGAATLVTLGTAVVDTADMADTANSRILIPASGVYLIAWQSGALENSTDYGFSGQAGLACRGSGGTVIPGTFAELITEYGTSRDRSHAAVCPLEAGDTVRLYCQSYGAGLDKLQNPSAVGGSTVRFRLTVERLHDLPAGV